MTAVASDDAGDDFGPYRRQALIGAGGMGEVYRAEDTVRGRIVALKILHAHLAANQEFVDRFQREDRIVARLSSPHVIPIHDYGIVAGRLFLDMRLVDGGDLGGRLRERGALPAAEVRRAHDIALF